MKTKRKLRKVTVINVNDLEHTPKDKKYRNRLNETIIKLKLNAKKKFLGVTNPNPRKVWKYFKCAIKLKRNRTCNEQSRRNRNW